MVLPPWEELLRYASPAETLLDRSQSAWLIDEVQGCSISDLLGLVIHSAIPGRYGCVLVASRRQWPTCTNCYWTFSVNSILRDFRGSTRRRTTGHVAELSSNGCVTACTCFFPFLTTFSNLLLTWVVIPAAALLLGVLPFLWKSCIRGHDNAPSALVE
jgi:hypothetical protein